MFDENLEFWVFFFTRFLSVSLVDILLESGADLFLEIENEVTILDKVITNSLTQQTIDVLNDDLVLMPKDVQSDLECCCSKPPFHRRQVDKNAL